MKKLFLVLSGYCIGLGGLALITYRTLLAIGSESKSVLVLVNAFGEQYLDLFCLVVLWGICLLGLYFLFSFLKEQNLLQSIIGGSHLDAVEKTPMVVFGEGSSAVPSDSSSCVVGTFNGLFRGSDLNYFSLDADGTAGVFSVSVMILNNVTSTEK